MGNPSGGAEPVTISVCMIVRNEQEVLARCLDCAGQFADQIVVVDTGSTDKTAGIAARYTGSVYSFPWCDDFSAARNFSFSKGTCDYLMWLDADDVVDGENIARILALKNTMDPAVDVAMFHYNTGFDDAGNVTFRYYRERMVRRTGGYLWQEPVHEHIALHGVIREYDIAITHGHKARESSGRNLNIYEKQLEQGTPLSSRGLYYFARELCTHGRYEEGAVRFREFLDRPDGWSEDRINACAGLSDCLCSLGRRDEALRALTESFAVDLPRAELLCRMGAIYMDLGRDDLALYWYRLALETPRPRNSWGFVAEDCWGFIPHMQLCVLLDRAGRRDQALLHHRAAKSIKPQDPRVLYNENYFSGLPN